MKHALEGNRTDWNRIIRNITPPKPNIFYRTAVWVKLFVLSVLVFIAVWILTSCEAYAVSENPAWQETDPQGPIGLNAVTLLQVGAPTYVNPLDAYRTGFWSIGRTNYDYTWLDRVNQLPGFHVPGGTFFGTSLQNDEISAPVMWWNFDNLHHTFKNGRTFQGSNWRLAYVDVTYSNSDAWNTSTKYDQWFEVPIGNRQAGYMQWQPPLGFARQVTFYGQYVPDTGSSLALLFVAFIALIASYQLAEKI